MHAVSVSQRRCDVIRQCPRFASSTSCELVDIICTTQCFRNRITGPVVFESRLWSTTRTMDGCRCDWTPRRHGCITSGYLTRGLGWKRQSTTPRVRSPGASPRKWANKLFIELARVHPSRPVCQVLLHHRRTVLRTPGSLWLGPNQTHPPGLSDARRNQRRPVTQQLLTGLHIEPASFGIVILLSLTLDSTLPIVFHSILKLQHQTLGSSWVSSPLRKTGLRRRPSITGVSTFAPPLRPSRLA